MHNHEQLLPGWSLSGCRHLVIVFFLFLVFYLKNTVFWN